MISNDRNGMTESAANTKSGLGNDPRTKLSTFPEATQGQCPRGASDYNERIECDVGRNDTPYAARTQSTESSSWNKQAVMTISK